MPEPATTATATIIGASAVIPALSAFGVPLGLRTDILIAGFFGSLVAIILLNTVPVADDTWRELIRTSVRRMMVACASSITAGYMTPLALLLASIPESLLLSMAFLTGVAAQKVLINTIRRYWPADSIGGPLS